MNNLKGKYGFGCMRLPMIGEEVDYDHFSLMIKEYFEAGFNYFDTAHGYINGKSEIALKECLTSKYPRESYFLADKLTAPYFEKEEDIRPFFKKQLDIVGVEYFDYYLLHTLNKNNYKKMTYCNAFNVTAELKKEGKIKNLGFSFHDKADFLDQILTEHPDMDFVQIQFNYVDFEDPTIEGRKCYEVCQKHNTPVIIMEPVKGGNLANLPDDAKTVFTSLNGGSEASYAMRYLASFDNIMMVLSGVSNIEQMRDNINVMKEFKPLNDEELKAVYKVAEILKSKKLISCTDCKYCVPDCPQNILIPNLFSCYNIRKTYDNKQMQLNYDNFFTKANGKAGDCISCKKCEKVCPQHLEISSLMKEVSSIFDR